jgi:hypothetical protein
MKPTPLHTPRLLPLAAAPTQAWRNGGGVTRELLAEPAGADWHWRISVAEITASGPFSAFAGVARWFAVLRGAGVVLTLGGDTVPLHPGDAPLAFDGASAPHCALLDGPTQDLNLMLRGGLAGGLFRAHTGTHWHACAAQGGLYSLVAGTLHADDQDLHWPVPADTLCWFDQVPARLRFDADTAADTEALAFWLAVGEPHQEPAA